MDILSLNKKMVCPKSDIKLVGHVIDTGVNPVGILAGRVETVRYADVAGNTSRTLSGGKIYDYSDRYGNSGHGTGVAYLMCHDVPNMRIRSYNTFIPYGSVNECLEAVLSYVKDHPDERHIVNMSLHVAGTLEDASVRLLHQLIQELVKLNVAVVVAAGNDGRERLDAYPSCFAEPITVAALYNDGRKTEFSVWHGEVDFTDVGAGIPRLTKDGVMQTASGTSFSTPIVCNKLAKIWCGNPDLTEPQLYDAAVKNTLDLGADGHDPYFGWGWIQSVKAPAATVRPLAKISAFVSWLKAQVRHIYMWGGQGETATESLIKRRETSTANANRAIALLRKRKAEGMETVLAYDCSGLGMKWLMDKKILPKDLTAAGMYSVCQKITKADLKAGDFVFVYGLSGLKKKIHHVGYVVDDSLNVVEAMGRDDGVVMRPLSAGKWNRYGRLNSLQG